VLNKVKSLINFKNKPRLLRNFGIGLIIGISLIIFAIILIRPNFIRRTNTMGWVRFGRDDFNTNFFPKTNYPQIRTQNQSVAKKSDLLQQEILDFKLAWTAEEFCLEPFRLVGWMQKMNYNLRTCDINLDGKLEIIVGLPNKTLILDHQGIYRYSLPPCFDIYQNQTGDVAWIACSLNKIQYVQGKKIRQLRTVCPIISVRIIDMKDYDSDQNLFLTVEKSNLFQINCYDPNIGQQRWSYSVDILPFISAIGDINGDERNEIICTSFVPDKGVGRVFALSSSGVLVWQVVFNAQSNFLGHDREVAAYTDAAISDLNGDGKQEVIAIFGTEDGTAGRLAIIDGKTGEIIDQYPRERFLRRSFTSLGIADMDNDGKSDIVVATRGKTARFYSFRFGTIGLETLATRRYSPLTLREPGLVSAWVWALTDIDADNEIEILSSLVYEIPLYTDWTLRSFQFLEPTIVVFDERFREKTNLELDERCLAMAVSDLIKGVSNEILILTDRLYLYGLK